jgi:hypothetical protein
MNNDRMQDAMPDRASTGKASRTGMTRREFARRTAMASAMASLAPAVAAGTAVAEAPAAPQPAEPQGPPAPAPVQLPAAPQAPPQPTPASNLPKLSPESRAEVDVRVQAILNQYGSRLSDEQKADILRLCTLAQPPLDRLRAYHLENSDGPALYLKPLVEREKKPATAKAPAAAPAKKP